MSLVETPTTHKPDEHTINKFQTLPQTFDKPLSPKKIESPPNKTESPIFSAKEPNPNDQNKINDLDHTIKKMILKMRQLEVNLFYLIIII